MRFPNAHRQLVALTGIAVSAVAQDTTRVNSDGPGRWGPNARLVHEFTIGELDGPSEYAFGRVNWLAAESGGAFYVFDAQQSQIRRYDTNGRFERLIGRRGGGPGEYQQAMGMEVTSGGFLLVYDRASQRITYFQPDGKVRREFSLLRGDFDARGFLIDTAGRLYVKSRLPGPPEGPSARHQFLRLSREGVVSDSFPIPRDETPVGSSFFLVTSDGARSNFPAQQVLAAPYALGGMVTTRADRYRFVVTSPGRPILVVQRPQSRVPLDVREREEWLAIAREMPPHLRTPNVQYDIPKLKPVMRNLFSDHLGRIWVDVYVAAEKRNVRPRRPGDTRPLLTWRERTTYDVFAPQGTYLGRLQLPAESRVLDVRDNRVYLLTQGPDGEDRVSLYRIVEGQ
jgi:hypothetical protein